MKITEYSPVTSLTADNIFLVDGDAGTKKILVMDAILAGLHLAGPENHRRVFRGKNLGGVVTSAQKSAIQQGTFEDLWLGDYWEINGTKWRIVDFDYWYNVGDTAFTKHHVLVMPDGILYTAAMNASLVTDGGYTGSQMYTSGLSKAKSQVTAAFGSNVLTHRNYFINAVSNGKPSAGAWVDSEVDLPNEPMIYGSYMETPSGSDVKRYTIDKTQLALFALHPKFITERSEYWLRDVVSTTMFANVGYYGSATSANATKESGVRPIVAIG